MSVASRAILARFAGKCRQCGRSVAKGEAVYFAKGYGVRCSMCGAHPADAQPMPSRSAAKSGLTAQQIESLKSRLAAGEKITHLAREVNIPWQRLWSILNAGQPMAPAASAQPAVEMGDRCATQCQDGVWRYEFGSVGEATIDALADYGQNEDARKALKDNLDESLAGQRRWANYFTRSKFMKELASPDKALLAAVDEMRESMMGEIAAPTQARRKIRRNQEWGEELDVDRYMSRSITPWDRTVREQQTCRNITIGCNLSVNSGVAPEQLLYRGAAAIALADMLTSQGFNVSIVAFESVESPTSAVSKGVMRYTLKDSTMPLDIASVAFAMCEIAWVRIVGIIGEMRHFPGQISPGYGRAVKLPAADRASCDFVIESDILSKEAAQAWLKACIGQQHVAA